MAKLFPNNMKWYPAELKDGRYGMVARALFNQPRFRFWAGYEKGFIVEDEIAEIQHDDGNWYTLSRAVWRVTCPAGISIHDSFSSAIGKVSNGIGLSSRAEIRRFES